MEFQFRVVTTYLEMRSAAEAVPFAGERRLELRRCELPCPELNRFFYASVGAEFWWLDRLSWTHERWKTYVDRPELHTWLGSVSGTPVGYFELEVQKTGSADDVEIVYFGLLPGFVAKGYGSELLAGAIERAWALGPARVWLHTCNLDHSRALPNYQASGFRIYRTAEQLEDLPRESPRAWPGAEWPPVRTLGAG